MSLSTLENSRKLDELAEKHGGYVVMGRGDDTRSGIRAISDYVKKTKEPLPLTHERMMEIDELLMAQ
ncbi:MAG: hypothetical protein FWB80_13315 [Defluviitaleaceae bacterium]|nr:hypothetical protein [Defluviitaleaceae bacterium]